MLVLTIRARAFVKIGDDIRVYNNSDKAISVAIEAPRDLVISRSDGRS